MDFSLELTPDLLIAFLTLFVLEVVLGVDNVIFISILASKPPPPEQHIAHRTGQVGIDTLVKLRKKHPKDDGGHDAGCRYRPDA